MVFERLPRKDPRVSIKRQNVRGMKKNNFVLTRKKRTGTPNITKINMMGVDFGGVDNYTYIETFSFLR